MDWQIWVVAKIMLLNSSHSKLVVGAINILDKLFEILCHILDSDRTYYQPKKIYHKSMIGMNTSQRP